MNNSLVQVFRSCKHNAGFEQASDGTKQITEIMPHPASGDADDRDAYASPVQHLIPHPSANLVGGPDFDPEPEVLDHGTTREVGIQVGALPFDLRLSTLQESWSSVVSPCVVCVQAEQCQQTKKDQTKACLPADKHARVVFVCLLADMIWFGFFVC